MSELTLTVIKLGFLALLWLFVLSAFSVVRSDLFGTRSARTALPDTDSTRSRRSGRRGSRRSRAAPRRPRGEPSVARVVEGPDTGLSAPLTGQSVTIGRGPGNVLPLTDDYVSTSHAVLNRHEGAWYVEDLGSTNGTHLDGVRVRTATVVPPGSGVRVGKTVIELQTV
jgi:hypothetical protein